MSTQTRRDSAGQRDGLQPNHCTRRHHCKENNCRENWAKRDILFTEEFASQHLVTVQPEQKPELLQGWVRRGTEPLLGTFSWRAGPHGTCTTFQLQGAGTCQQPQKHFRLFPAFPASEAWKRAVKQILSPITGNASRNERQKRRKCGH